MKKIITTMAMACLSFSCFAENYFVKVADNEYVLQHGEKSKDLGINNSGFGAVAPVDAIYTPTHIFTYPDGNPAQFRNIQKIEYTESNATFYKDMKTRKCCIDILDDKENEKKCRIIGVNGHNIGSFEVYEAADEANSFTDSTPRLIFVDHSGLYIVSEKENPIEDISKNHFRDGSFDFKGEVIKISAVEGKREMLGFDENKKAIFAFNCPSDALVFFDKSNFTQAFAEKFAPVMKQIQRITGIRPKTVPSSEKATLKRMAEILDIPVELLVFENGSVAVVGTVRVGNVYSNKPDARFRSAQLYKIMPASRQEVAVDDEVIEKVRRYTFDTSPEAKQRRKEIALKPWDE